MDPVHDRGSMDPVHESGPWTRSKVGVHGPLVHVLSSPAVQIPAARFPNDINTASSSGASFFAWQRRETSDW